MVLSLLLQESVKQKVMALLLASSYRREKEFSNNGTIVSLSLSKVLIKVSCVHIRSYG